MSGNNKLIAGLVIGAAAGAAIALFLTSDKGKELLDKIKEGPVNAGEDLLSEWNDKLNELWDRGISMVGEMEEKFKKETT